MRESLKNGAGDAAVLLPYSEEAEQALLGCCLLVPGEVIPKIVERTEGKAEIFYDVRLQELWGQLLRMHQSGTEIDLITLATELRDSKHLEAVGGVAFLSSLMDMVPSTANLPYYLDIVWEKYLAREFLHDQARLEGQVKRVGGLDETTLVRAKDTIDRLERMNERGKGRPKLIAKAADFDEGYFNHWFKRKEEDNGLDWPVELADFKIRRGEMTVFTAENGAGKSTFLKQAAIVAAKQGMKPFIASMEERPETCLWIMSRQLRGVSQGHAPETPENFSQLSRSLAWLNQRVLFYNFLGIADWRDLYDTMRYAREHEGSDFFVIDSAMRLGIEDDDYALQGVVSTLFSNFAIHSKSHVVIVIHQNKSGDGGMKKGVRGSGLWTDNAHNVAGIMRNDKKAEKLEELWEKKRVGEIDDEIYDKAVYGMRMQWDSKLLLKKQRFPGSRQNGSRYLFFDRASLQFWEKPDAGPFDYTIA